ncbi:MAG: MFS transporter [Phycisphaerae bacterium]|nr:MFS transporter [Tepidisphaeraceae bacterium]
MNVASRWKMLNLTWVSFFLTFVVWFNLAPFTSSIAKAMNLTKEQVHTLIICNVALTIPARIFVGRLVDRYGPRRVFSAILVIFAVPCLLFAMATEYWQLVVLRLAISGIGAGFVVGIRLVGEWFDAREIGLAEGIYGGLGNFGMAVASFALPLLAAAFGGVNGWRWAMAISAVLCVIWAFVYLRHAQDAPPGKHFKASASKGALEVSSRGDLIALSLMQIPLLACMGIIAWRLVGVHLIAPWVGNVFYVILPLLFVRSVFKIRKANAHLLRSRLRRESDSTGVGVEQGEHHYSFAQVAILCLCYAVTFGGELAVESMLPAYFEKMFGVSVATAGVLGAGFAFASLIARPLGGYLGDKYGRRPVIIISLAGSAAGFFAIHQINNAWPLWAVMTVTMLAGLFLMAANGANFCIAPLIRKPLTGQIAGLIGAYGNVGSVLFLALLSITTPSVFFLTMGIVGVAAFAACFMLREPARIPHHEEARPVEAAPVGAQVGNVAMA